MRTRIAIFIGLTLLRSAPVMAIPDADLHKSLADFCAANQKDSLIAMSFTCKLAREKLSLVSVCEAASKNNTREQLRIDEIAMNYAKATGKDESQIKNQLCAEANSKMAAAEKPQCDSEATGATKIRRTWWNGESWIATNESLSEIQKSASTGDAHSQFNLGYWNESGAPCIPKDHAKAVQFLCQAYDQGFSMARVQLASLGKNEGLPAEKAREGLGKRYGCTLTAHQKELAAEDAKLAELAKQWRTKAEQGDARAQLKLGLAYMNGDGVEQNSQEAAKWVRKSAEHGNAEAMETLGSMYSRGDGVPDDNEECFKWYLRAAQHGRPEAQYFVGHLYHRGQGVQENLKEAVRWYSKALDGGSRDAREELVRMWINGELASVIFQSLHQRLRALEKQQHK